MLEIFGARVVLRPLGEGDRAQLRALVEQPAIALRWKGSRTFDEVVDEMYEPDGHTPLAITLEGDVIGYIQFDEELDRDYRHASIDVFVDSAVAGRGLGTDAVATLARWLVRERGHHRVTIDPALDNAPAIRSYEKAGFRRVGVMRQYERGLDGAWHDSLLLDLVASDLD